MVVALPLALLAFSSFFFYPFNQLSHQHNICICITIVFLYSVTSWQRFYVVNDDGGGWVVPIPLLTFL